MPLTKIGNLLQGVTFTTPEVIVYKPRWLYAQRSRFWVDADPTQTGHIIFIYRSKVVLDTDKCFAPVADLILESEQVDDLFEARYEDPTMMHYEGQSRVFGLVPLAFKGPYTPAEVRLMLTSLVDEMTWKGEMAS